MAFGFPPSYEIDIDLLGERQSVRHAVAYAFEVLGWKYRTTDPDHFQAKVKNPAAIWDEIFVVSLGEGMIKLRSASSSYPLPGFDWGKNKQNVERFLTHYSQKELRDFKTRPGEPAYVDEDGSTPLERVLSQDSEKR